jgi:hypothetical protein
MATPQSVRLGPHIQSRLTAFAAAHPGMSVSNAIATLVDEGLRMQEHPGIVFRDGPMGRRAALAAGPDVWEVVRALLQAKIHEPDMSDNDRLELVAVNSGLAVGQVRDAVGYWSAYPDEVDRLVREADAAEEAALVAWERRTELLS